jgi:putative flippase GtrA
MSLLGSFCVVGTLAFFTNWLVFNIVEFSTETIFGHHITILSAILANALALIVGYYGNKYYSFNGKVAPNSIVRFLLINILAGVIQYLCIFLGHRFVREDSILLDNITSYLIGVPLGLIVRFVFYKRWVFLRQES